VHKLSAILLKKLYFLEAGIVLSCTSLTLPYLTSGVGRLLHLPSAEAVSAQANAHPRM